MPSRKTVIPGGIPTVGPAVNPRELTFSFHDDPRSSYSDTPACWASTSGRIRGCHAPSSDPEMTEVRAGTPELTIGLATGMIDERMRIAGRETTRARLSATSRCAVSGTTFPVCAFAPDAASMYVTAAATHTATRRTPFSRTSADAPRRGANRTLKERSSPGDPTHWVVHATAQRIVRSWYQRRYLPTSAPSTRECPTEPRRVSLAPRS